MTKSTWLFVATLSFSLSKTAFAIPSSFSHVAYSCRMACGKLSVGGGNCRGLQVSGEITKDAAGNWSGKHSEFIFSPDMYEYFEAFSGCAADFTAKINVVSPDAIYFSFEQGTYQVPQICSGGVLNSPNPPIIPRFTLFAHKSGSTPLAFSATATVPRKTDWPQRDVYPDCEISFQ